MEEEEEEEEEEEVGSSCRQDLTDRMVGQEGRGRERERWKLLPPSGLPRLITHPPPSPTTSSLSRESYRVSQCREGPCFSSTGSNSYMLHSFTATARPDSFHGRSATLLSLLSCSSLTLQACFDCHTCQLCFAFSSPHEFRLHL